MARGETIGALKGRGNPDPDEEVEGFEEHFMDFLTTIIMVQPRSAVTSPPSMPSKSPYRDLAHQMSKVDAKIPATSGVGKFSKPQDIEPAPIQMQTVPSRTVGEIKTSSVNIIIPPEARVPPELVTIMDDPNIARAIE
jgi:hypothetical protein